MVKGDKARMFCNMDWHSIGERRLTEKGPALWLEEVEPETENEEEVCVRDCTFLLQPHWLSSCTNGHAYLGFLLSAVPSSRKVGGSS